MSGVGFGLTFDMEAQLREKADKVSAEFQSPWKDRGYDPKYWVRYLSIVFDILWKEKWMDRIFDLNRLCERYLEAEKGTKEKQDALDALYEKFRDLCLMAEYVEQHPHKNIFGK